MQFMKHNRGSMDLQGWMTRFQITGNRLIESWMDLLPDVAATHSDALAFIEQQRVAHNTRQQELVGIAAAVPGGEPHVPVPWTAEMATGAYNDLNTARRLRQRQAFPLGDNLSALIFVTLADLTQDQRNTLTSIMTHRGRTLEQYNITELRDIFLEMFCTTKTSVDNPMIQPSAIGQRRSFLVLEEGELEGTDGYWAEDDEDGAEGFLDALEDVFWVYDDTNYTWYQRRFQGRQPRRGGKGKGKRKGRGKGRGGRRFFRSRRKGKGKGKRRKGRAHMVGEDEEEEWQDTEDYETWQDGYWAEDENWNEGYWADEDLYYKDEYGYFQRKGKGKGKGEKGKKGKDDEGKGGKPGDGKGKSNYVQPQPQFLPAPQQQAHYSSAASTGHGFLTTVEPEPARVETTTVDYSDQQPTQTRRTRRGGQNRRDETARQNREERKQFPVHVGEVDALQGAIRRQQPHPVPPGPQSSAASFSKPCEKGTSFFTYGCSESLEEPSQLEGFQPWKVSTEDQSAFSFHTNQPDLACENGLAFHNENSAPPTVCILDLGCTRAMGLERQLTLSADMLAHIHIVDYGMRFNQQIRDSSLQIHNNQSVLKRLSSTCMIMDGHLSSQSSTLSKKVMSHC